MTTCPLCGGTDISPYHADNVRDYLHCADCSLVFVPASQQLDPDA